jgi:outer membrane protein OmpA-like peptidoglycan-associated protein
MRFKCCFYVSWIIVSLVSAGAVNAQVYSADLTSSEWKVASNPFACSLTHVIPSFGKAVFSRKAGGADVFYLESQGKVVFPSGTTTIETMPPVWRSDIVPVSLGTITTVAGNQPISLTNAQLAPLVAQLSNGVNVMYSSQAVASASSSSAIMRVVLNAKNFTASYKSYQQCVANIIPYSFAQVARTFINYAEKTEGLTASNKADLNKVARYVKADANVVGVFVDGHSDNSHLGDANETVSKQAAEWVAAYLVEQGVAANKITTRWHGDKFLIASNATQAGRAQNRRVTVRLEDEAAHKEFMKKEEENRKADEKVAADKTLAETKKAEAGTSASSSSIGKMTPEEISRMVEGFDLKKTK